MSIESIKARLEAATPGPWRRFGITGITSPDYDLIPEPMFRGTCGGDCDAEITVINGMYPEDVDFIAHAPTDIAALLKLAEAVRELAYTISADDRERQKWERIMFAALDELEDLE